MESAHQFDKQIEKNNLDRTTRALLKETSSDYKKYIDERLFGYFTDLKEHIDFRFSKLNEKLDKVLDHIGE